MKLILLLLLIGQFSYGQIGSGATVASNSYLGQVATRCVQPRAFNSGLTYAMARSVHYSRDVINNPILVMPNYYLGSHNDVNGGGTGTIKVAIEYPSGTYTLANENIANSSNGVSFPVGLTPLHFTITIPNNVKFWVRSYHANTNGIVYFQYQTAYLFPSTEEGLEIGSGAGTDKTTSGTISSGSGAFTYTPVLILANTTKPSVCIIGTSREEGFAEAITDGNYDVGLTARGIGPTIAYLSLAESASTIAQWNAATRTYRDKIINGTITGVGNGTTPYFSHITDEYGVNDIAAGDAASTLAGRRTTFAALYPKVKVIGHTLIPNNQSTDGWLSKTNQALGSNQPKILTFNDLVRAGISGEYAYWDVADGADRFRESKYPATRNPNDATRATTCTFTGAISGTTLTVSAIASGSLSLNDPITDNLTTLGSVQAGTYITAQLSGTTGSTGTYSVSKNHSSFPYASAVTSKTMYVGAFATNDGLHPTAAGSLMIRDAGVIKLHLLNR